MPKKNQTYRSDRRRRQLGLTLIEILIVVAILGLVAGVVSVNLVGQWRDSEIKAAQLDLKQLSNTLDLYRLKYGRYPSSAEGLNALITPPGGGESLLRKGKLPQDPWGTTYIYARRTDGPSLYALRSMGPDGVENTDDDIDL